MPDSPSPIRRWRRRPGLRTLLMLQVLAPLVLLLGGGMLVGFHLLEQQVEGRMQDEVALVARAIRLPLVHALQGEAEMGVERVLESALLIRRVYGAYVFGPSGQRLASYGPSPTQPSPDLAEGLAQGVRSGEYGEAGGEAVFSYFIPLTDSWGRSLGTLQVTRLRSDIDRDIGALRARALFLLVVTLLAIALLVQAGLHGSIVEPLRRLVAAMRRIREGDPTHRIQPGGPDELREVALSFNATMDSLQEAGAEIARRRDEERRLARELAEAERLAAVGELAAGVAHELGTPLGIVAGAARRLQRRPDPDETGELVRLIHDGVSRTESIVRQLMELGRRGDPRKRRLQVGSLTGSAVAAQRETALQRGVEVDRTSGTASGEVQADPRQLSLALGHLIRNAIRAARTQVRVVSGRRNDQVFLRVEDDGPGVPPEIRSRIFDPFFTTRTPGEGTGLGLAVVEDVVRAHGGRVSLVPSALGGAGFEILLPACDP